MLIDVIFESVRFLARDDLDACQLASKAISNFIAGSPTLALRTLGNVVLGRTLKSAPQSTRQRQALSECKARDVVPMVLYRNVYISRMTLSTGTEQCVPLLGGVSMKVGRLHYEENLQETETLERSVEWIVRDLRVTAYELFLCDHDGDDQVAALLPSTLGHHSVRATAEYLFANVFTRSPATVLLERLFDLLFDAPKLAAVL